MKAKFKTPLFAKESGTPKASERASQRPTPSHQEIAECAHALWENRGRPEGEAGQIWLEAEQKLMGGLHLSSDDDAHFANKNAPLNDDGDPSGDVEERLRSFDEPDNRSSTSL